jgi:hypothetical protein
MADKYEKVDGNTLRKIETPPAVTSTVDRAEIQTQIDHLELDKQKIQLEIDELKSQIAILDA